MKEVKYHVPSVFVFVDLQVLRVVFKKSCSKSSRGREGLSKTIKKIKERGSLYSGAAAPPADRRAGGIPATYLLILRSKCLVREGEQTFF